MNFEETYLDKIICGDCLEVMRKMPDKCLDLVVTSPPYNLKKFYWKWNESKYNKWEMGW